jgi:hypothetical protein
MKLPDKPKTVTRDQWKVFLEVIETLQDDYIIAFRDRPSEKELAAYTAKAREARGDKPKSFYRTIGRKGAKSRWGEWD